MKTCDVSVREYDVLGLSRRGKMLCKRGAAECGQSKADFLRIQNLRPVCKGMKLSRRPRRRSKTKGVMGTLILCGKGVQMAQSRRDDVEG